MGKFLDILHWTETHLFSPDSGKEYLLGRYVLGTVIDFPARCSRSVPEWSLMHIVHAASICPTCLPNYTCSYDSSKMRDSSKHIEGENDKQALFYVYKANQHKSSWFYI